jgi:hypothetical protein
MKIKISEVKKIIKEEVEAAYQRYKQLTSPYGSDDSHVVDAARYGAFNDLPGLFSLKVSAKDYYDFFNKARAAGHNMTSTRMYAFYNSSFKSEEELMAVVEELKALEARFVEEDVTSETDVQYGRKTKQIVDKTTGKVVNRSHDRPGSLGT